MADETLKSSVLVKDGVWQVPIDQRPANWQTMGLNESEVSVAVAVIEPPAEPAPPAVPITSVVANSTAELPGLQGPLIPWAQNKLEEARAEHAELAEAIEHAKKRKWKFTSMVKAAKNALSRFTFYDKVVKALEAGYMLFPPVPNAAVFAIRTDSNCQWGTRWLEWGFPTRTAQAVGLPAGEGEYANPYVKWIHVSNRKNDQGKELRLWEPLHLEDPTFPLVMAKPEIVEAVNAAMEMKVFDEIRMFPLETVAGPTPRVRFPKEADPCILGSIFDKRNDKRHYFLISWRIDQKDI